MVAILVLEEDQLKTVTLEVLVAVLVQEVLQVQELLVRDMLEVETSTVLVDPEEEQEVPQLWVLLDRV